MIDQILSAGYAECTRSGKVVAHKMNQELLANTTLSHYRIISEIGAGGMGEVYLAEDTTLDRKVALKLLPAPVIKVSPRIEPCNSI